jgi:hypothetical protein
MNDFNDLILKPPAIMLQTGRFSRVMAAKLAAQQPLQPRKMDTLAFVSRILYLARCSI